MRVLKLILPVATLLHATASYAATVNGSGAQVDIAQVAKLIPLLDKPGLKVNVAVEDVGGSTDMSPTQRLYLTLYAKGEICSPAAAFDIGQVYSVESAKRVGGGLYEIAATIPTEEAPYMKPVTYMVDARKAVTLIQDEKCDDFEAPKPYYSIDVTVK